MSVGAEPELEVRRESFDDPRAKALVEALDSELLGRYPDEGDGFFGLLAEHVTEGRGVFLVAYVEGRPVGCGAIRSLDDTCVEVKRMYVVPEARGTGVARRVLAALEAEARSLGRTRIVLETGLRQPEAIALYRRHGYTETDRFGDYPYSPLSVWLGKDLR